MAVADAIRESMSAVMDGEGTEMDLARVLKAVEEDPAARDHWQRLQRSGYAQRTGSSGSSVDISVSVQAALANAGSHRKVRRVGPMGSLAVAASVTFAVVFGGQMLVGSDSPVPTAQVPGGVIALQGGAPVQASFGTRSMATQPQQRQVNVAATPSVSKVYEQLARERFSRYATEHAQSTAALQPNAIVPYARVPYLER